MKKILAGIFSLCGCFYAIGGHAENMCCAPEDQCGDVCCPTRGCNEAATACAEVDPCEAGLDGYGYMDYSQTQCAYCSDPSIGYDVFTYNNVPYCGARYACEEIFGYSGAWSEEDQKCCILEEGYGLNASRRCEKCEAGVDYQTWYCKSCSDMHSEGYGYAYPSFSYVYCDGYGTVNSGAFAGYCHSIEWCKKYWGYTWSYSDGKCCSMLGDSYGYNASTGSCEICSNGVGDNGICNSDPCASGKAGYGKLPNGECVFCSSGLTIGEYCACLPGMAWSGGECSPCNGYSGYYNPTEASVLDGWGACQRCAGTIVYDFNGMPVGCEECSSDNFEICSGGLQCDSVGGVWCAISGTLGCMSAETCRTKHNLKECSELTRSHAGWFCEMCPENGGNATNCYDCSASYVENGECRFEACLDSAGNPC